MNRMKRRHEISPRFHVYICNGGIIILLLMLLGVIVFACWICIPVIVGALLHPHSRWILP